MEDEKGLYYYPNPADKQTRMYVRQGAGDIEFRLWRQEYPEVWEKHDWVPYSVLHAAAAMYKERGSAADPMALYDLSVGEALVKEALRKKQSRR